MAAWEKIEQECFEYIKDNYADYLNRYLKKDIILRDAKKHLFFINLIS